MNKMIVVSHSLQDQTDIQLAMALGTRGGLDSEERKQVREEFKRRFQGMRWREGEYQITQQAKLQIPARRKAMRGLPDAELENRLLVPDVGEVALASAEINRRRWKYQEKPNRIAAAKAALDVAIENYQSAAPFMKNRKSKKAALDALQHAIARLRVAL